VPSSERRRHIVHAYELRIRGLDDELARTAARRELFALPNVRDLVRGTERDRFLVLYEGCWEHPSVWRHVLANPGYEAEPIGRVEETHTAS